MGRRLPSSREWYTAKHPGADLPSSIRGEETEKYVHPVIPPEEIEFQCYWLNSDTFEDIGFASLMRDITTLSHGIFQYAVLYR
jgi:hypothetical protein